MARSEAQAVLDRLLVDRPSLHGDDGPATN